MTRHTYLPITLITDKGTTFTSCLVDEIAKILGIQIKYTTTKHSQTIARLKRTHASLKVKGNLKMASGEYRRQWHKYLPLAVLKYNTTYNSSLGCEPSKQSRIFHGRVPYNILDHRLALNPETKFLLKTDLRKNFKDVHGYLLTKQRKTSCNRT